jgi:hypothetical protein
MAAVGIWSSHAERQEPLPLEFLHDYDYQRETYDFLICINYLFYCQLFILSHLSFLLLTYNIS